MGVLTAAQFTWYVDKLTAASLAAIGSSGSGFGDGDSSLAQASDYGVSRKVRDLLSGQLLWGDYDLNSILSKPTHDLQNTAPYQKDLPARFQAGLTQLNAACAASGLVLTGGVKVNNALSFAQYYNIDTGGPFGALVPPDFRTLWFYASGLLAYPDTRFVYSPAITNMGQWVVSGAGTGTFTPGTGADTTKYAGAAVSTLTVTGFAGASGLVTVTGSALSSAGVVNAGRTFTATVAANGNYSLTPTNAGDILQSVSSIGAANAITGGTIVVGGQVPNAAGNMGQVTITGAGTVGSLSSVNTLINGAPQAALIATGITGSGVATVTGNALTANGSGPAAVGRTFTVTVTGIGQFVLVPTNSGDLLQTVTSIGVASGLTAGQLVVAGQRLNPPA